MADLTAFQRLKDVLLRIYDGSDLLFKGDSLTWVEEDKNFVWIVEAIMEVAMANASNFQVFNSSIQYQITTPSTYRTYDGRVYKYIGASPSTGIVPGQDQNFWQLVPQGEFAHQQNTDSGIGFGTANYSTSSQIKIAVDNTKKWYFGATAPGVIHNQAAGYSKGSFGIVDNEGFQSLYLLKKLEVVIVNAVVESDTATWQLIWGSGE